jgi:sigma-E factor negative regulatory protein RseC
VIEETGTVVAVEGSYAWVERARASTCGSCSLKGGCGTSVLAQVLGRRTARVRAENAISARVGDRVVVGLAEAALLEGSLVMYLVPVLALLGGGLFGELMARRLALASADPLAAAGAVVATVLALLWVRGRIARERCRPVLMRRLN